MRWIRPLSAFLGALLLVCLGSWLAACPGDDPPATKPLRAILVGTEELRPELLRAWKSRGATAVVVTLDEDVKGPRWAQAAQTVQQAGLDLYAWFEVARNPRMADAHPEWMAAPGGHHDDWKRLFPNAPTANKSQVIKAWPWVPIGYEPAFNAHRDRIRKLLDELPGPWLGVFLNDLQAGPSSCGCGNSQCRWAIDYGSPSTVPKTPGEDAAARLVTEVQDQHPGKLVVPVWVTECEPVDLPGAPGGTGLCGGVPCAKGDCWPRYARAWDPLVKAARGPIALAGWPEPFRRDPSTWVQAAVTLFQNPPKDAAALPKDHTLIVLQGWDVSTTDKLARCEQAQRQAAGWVLAIEPIEQSWKPFVIPINAGAIRRR